MIVIRRILLEIRKLNANNTGRNLGLELIGAFGLLGLSILLDISVPFNFFWVSLRALFTFGSALLFFAVLYTSSYLYSDKKLREDPDYLITRKRFTYNQRKNYGILFGGFVLIQIFLTSQGHLYSIMSVLQIVQVLTILSFVRSTKSEFVKAELGVPDIQDIRYNRELQAKIAERKKRRRNRQPD